MLGTDEPDSLAQVIMTGARNGRRGSVSDPRMTV